LKRHSSTTSGLLRGVSLTGGVEQVRLVTAQHHCCRCVAVFEHIPQRAPERASPSKRATRDLEIFAMQRSNRSGTARRPAGATFGEPGESVPAPWTLDPF